jgi:hypothetical protein
MGTSDVVTLNGIHIRTFTTDEARAKILSHVFHKVRASAAVPEFNAIDVDQQVLAVLLAVGDAPIRCATDSVGNVAICTLTEKTLDPHCQGYGVYVSYFIAASSNPQVATTLMRLAVKYAKAVNANWLGTSKRVGVNRYASRYHYM